MITPSGWDLIRFTEANAGSDGRPWATAVPRRSPAAERALPAAPRPPPAAVTGTGAIGHGSRGARCRPKRVPARPDAEGSPREEGRSRDGAPRKGWRHGPGFPAPAQPFAGPASMEPLAEAVSAHGRVTAVPSAAGVARGAPPYWPRLVEAACGGAPDGPLIVVAHSNAGLFVPLIVAELGGRRAARSSTPRSPRRRGTSRRRRRSSCRSCATWPTSGASCRAGPIGGRPRTRRRCSPTRFSGTHLHHLAEPGPVAEWLTAVFPGR